MASGSPTLTTQHVFGDGVQVSRSGIVDWLTPNAIARNIHIERVTAHKTARHCYAPTQVDGYHLLDSRGTDCWYGAFDAESDDDGDPTATCMWSETRSATTTWSGSGYRSPTATALPATSRSATTSSRPDPTSCAIRWSSSARTRQIRRTSPTSRSTTTRSRSESGIGAEMDHVSLGSIQHNKDVNYIEAGCQYPPATPFAKITNSIDVTVADNDSSALGAIVDATP